jgi:hypothetical protein
MTDLKQDAVINVIENGIKRGINVTIENKCWRAATQLLLSGIDAMAFLDMAQGKQDVASSDFITWVDRYIDLRGQTKVTGADLYGARCAALHTYGISSKMSRTGKCREIGWMNSNCRGMPVMYRSEASKNLVLVSVPALRDFLRGLGQVPGQRLLEQEEGGCRRREAEYLLP